jgi:pimeloyl-ACP methyl ester carboxylesterase
MRADSSLESDVSDIIAVLEAERLSDVHVLGWCNGCGIAIELANRASARIASLVLLSPTLWQSGGQENAYQLGMYRIYAAVLQRPEIAPTCAAMFLEETRQGAASSSLTGDIEPNALLALPDERLAECLAAPSTASGALVRYSRRMMSDAAYPALDKLSAVSARVLVITGSHDHIVNAASTGRVLGNVASVMGHVTITGAGHYIQDTQYVYLRWLLEAFLVRSEIPASTARARSQASARRPQGRAERTNN